MNTQVSDAAQALPPEATILPQQTQHEAAIEALNETAFGPGRFTKTAYRLRRSNPPMLDFGRVCMIGDDLVGTVIFSPVRIASQAALLLGPLAVHPDHKNRGIGLALMREGIAAATQAGEMLVLLVGDAPYYAKVGFSPVPAGQIMMPGPVNPARLLARELVAGSLQNATGLIRADPRE